MKNSILSSGVLAITLSVAALSIVGCSAADKVENKISCNSVCNRYKDCFDSDYDVDACSDRCEAETNADEDKDRRLEVCKACIDDRSCSSATFNCATDCAGVIN
ncbi:MAG TPA: hypothetical protein VFQ61_10265 [Polyangiaceae bacterium]|nr:hypothetical protein [Polyangiaceae bacterium]